MLFSLTANYFFNGLQSRRSDDVPANITQYLRALTCHGSAVGRATGYELEDPGIGVRVPVGFNN
jgi:hypothetical protein